MRNKKCFSDAEELQRLIDKYFLELEPQYTYDDENNIIVPGYIVKDNGDVLLVKEIASNAFATTKPTRLDATTSLFDLFTESAGKTYNDIDVATLKIILETYLTKTIAV